MPGQEATWDIEITIPGERPIPFMFDRTAVVQGKSVARPASVTGAQLSPEEGRDLKKLDVPLHFRSVAGGMGYSRAVPGLSGVYDDADGVYCRGGGQVIVTAGQVSEIDLTALGFTDIIRASIIYNGDLRLFGGQRVLNIPGGSGTPFLEHTLSGSIHVESVVRYGGYLFIGGDSDLFWIFDGSNYTQGDTARRQAGTAFWVVQVNGATEGHDVVVMTNATSTEFQYFFGAPIDALNDANWSQAFTIDDNSYQINAIRGSRRHFYLLREDGVWDFNERFEIDNITSWARGLISPYSGKAGLFHDHYIYSAHGRGSFRVDVGTIGLAQPRVQYVTPAGQRLPYEGAVRGPVTAFFADDAGWVGQFVYNEQQNCSYLIYSKDRDVLNAEGVPSRGLGDFVFQGAEMKLPGEIVSDAILVLTSAGAARLYVASYETDTLVPHLRVQSQARSGDPVDDWRQGTDHTFGTIGTLNYGAQDWDDVGATKTVHLWQVAQENGSETAYTDVYAATGSGTYTLQGTAYGGDVTEITTVGAASDTPISGNWIKPQIILHGTDTDPVLFYALKTRAAVYIEPFDYRQYTVLIGKSALRADGVRDDERDTELVWAQLRALQTTDQIAFMDELKLTNQARIIPGLTWVNRESDDGKAWYRSVTFTVLVYPEALLWDEDVHWDTGKRWDS